MDSRGFGRILAVTTLGLALLGSPAYAASSGNAIEVLRQALFGAGVGAISAEVSGGKAGKGALIGAGTNVIGQALMGLLTGSSQSVYSQPVYQQPVYQQSIYQQPVYTHPAPPTQTVQRYYTYDTQPVYVQAAPTSYAPSYTYEDPNKRVLKQGLMGAGVGAISAEVSGGKAGQGALIGAGTNVIGSALMELLTN